MWTKPAVFLLVSLMSLSAAAFTPDLKALEDMTLVTRYPQGSLVSRESAEHALSEVKKAQSRLKEQADFAHRRCEENFFVNSCRDDVREARIRQERRLFQIEKEARGVIRSFNAKEEAARQAERDKKAKAAQRQRSDSKKAKTAQKPDAKLGTALSKRAQESKARQKAAEARKAKEAANRAKYELKQKKKAERIKAREEALAKRRAKEAAKAARGK
ncbi:hypothetical protein [Duodenibacillus massiliensis]|uniref:hypothetical protein n=1 Tax=Duodenibacillus massiliensis TaxID=1852381 RepID=UPI00307BAD22